MDKTRRIRVFGMLSILFLFLVYLIIRSLTDIDVLFLQMVTMLVGCAIAMAFMVAIYITDPPNRKTTLIGIVLIAALAVIALFNK